MILKKIEFIFRVNKIIYSYLRPPSLCVCVTLLLSSFLNSQNLSLDLGDLMDGKYDPKRLESIRSMKGGENYTVLQKDEATNSTSIISYSYSKSIKPKILVDSNSFPEKIKFSGYTFSKNDKIGKNRLDH